MRPLGTDRLELALGAAHANARRVGAVRAARAPVGDAGRRAAPLRRGRARAGRRARWRWKAAPTAGWASAWRWTSGARAAPSACTGRFPGSGRQRRQRRGAPARHRRARAGAGRARVRRARAAGGHRRRSRVRGAGAPAAQPGRRQARRRRAVQDREHRARDRAHRGAARPDGVPARARQARVRLRAVAVDARVLPGVGGRRDRAAPGGRAGADRPLPERHVLQARDGSHRRPRRSGAHRRVQGRDGAVRDDRAVARRARQQDAPAGRRLRPHDGHDRAPTAPAVGQADGRRATCAR